MKILASDAMKEIADYLDGVDQLLDALATKLEVPVPEAKDGMQADLRSLAGYLSNMPTLDEKLAQMMPNWITTLEARAEDGP